MKNKKPNAEHLWKQFEDLVVPRLRLSVIERAVYSHLLRHSRLEGRLRLRFSIPWLARGVRLCPMTARCALRRLFDLRVLRLVERNQVGHVVVVRLPQEIRALRPYIIAARGAARLPLPLASRTPISSKTRLCARPSTRASVAYAFTVCAALPSSYGPSTMSSLKLSRAAIPTATSSLAVAIATRKRGRPPPRTSSAASTASAA